MVTGTNLPAEVLRVLCRLPQVEYWRRRVGLHGAVERAREGGLQRPVRSPEGRTRLRRFIHSVDRRLPDGGNCVRRALLEMALDGGAAGERFLAGVRAGGGKRSGHAWLESETVADRYDAIFAI